MKTDIICPYCNETFDFSGLKDQLENEIIEKLREYLKNGKGSNKNKKM